LFNPDGLRMWTMEEHVMATSGDDYILSMLNRSLVDDYMITFYHRIISSVPQFIRVTGTPGFWGPLKNPVNKSAHIGRNEFYSIIRRSYELGYIQIPKTGSSSFFSFFD